MVPMDPIRFVIIILTGEFNNKINHFFADPSLIDRARSRHDDRLPLKIWTTNRLARLLSLRKVWDPGSSGILFDFF
jgi:hypothetical protein